MTDKQIRTLDIIDIICNVLATIQIIMTLLIIKYVRNNDIKQFFAFIGIICFIIICKSLFTKRKEI